MPRFLLRRPMRSLAPLALLCMAGPAAAPALPAPPPPEFVQAVEFPYYLYPRTLWERELVWLKNHRHPHGGVLHSLELAPACPGRLRFHRPHQPAPRPGRLRPAAAPARPAGLGASPAAGDGLAQSGNAGRRRCAARARLAQAARNNCWPPRPPATAARSPTSKGRALAIDAAAPPAPVTTISAIDPDALAASRAAIGAAASTGALLWTDVEDALYPAGWAAAGLRCCARARWA